ncbi:MAG: hypothetical protein Q9210_001414 [Variospora velana]
MQMAIQLIQSLLETPVAAISPCLLDKLPNAIPPWNRIFTSPKSISACPGTWKEGISNAGKSTILKHLQLVQRIEPTPVEVEEARRVILTGLIDAFRLRLLQSLRIGFIGDFHAVLHVLTHASNVLNDKGQLLREEHLVQGHPSHLANLCVHIQTIGVYQAKVTFDPFDFDICDVGGSRAARKKWLHCLAAKPDYVIYVVDLGGYSQIVQEDHDTNQMCESLEAFEKVINSRFVEDLPVFLLLNKADLFERRIVQVPVSEYFPDYDGAADYSKACRFFADRFADLDHRSPGKLHCYVTNSLDTKEFQTAWRGIHEKLIHTSLKY